MGRCGVSENLWPDDFGEIPLRTPVSILREQALALGQRTANIVVGRVLPGSAPTGRFRHCLQLVCAPLGYQSTFLEVDHDIELYPADIRLDGEQDPPIRAANPDDFSAKLREIFSREKTKRIIASLIAQSK